MRALSIRQPWAELILRGVKTVEYRSRPTRVIGERFHIYAPLKHATPSAKVWSRDLADANETYSFTLQESADNSAFTAAGAAQAVTATGTAVVKGRIKQRYVRLALTTGGTTPSITFKAWLNPLP